MQSIDFSQIRIHDGSQDKGFEELVCQLAKLSKPENAKEFIRKDGAGGDAGVECYWKLQDDSEHAWQAKYFLKPLGSSQWKQISKSVESALSKHPNLTKYYICLPKDRNDSRRSNTTGNRIISELDRWNQHVAQWKAIATEKSMQVEFEYWGAHEILLMLQRNTDGFTDIARYWFGVPVRDINILSYQYFPRDIVDQKIEEETGIIRRSRFFTEFDRAGSSSALARKLVEGEFLGGTDTVKCRALAWCVRILSHSGELDKAEKYIKDAKELGDCQEIDIAEACILSRKGDKNAALSTLANIDSPMSRSARFMFVVNHDGPQKAIEWLKTVGIAATDLDADGKRLLLGCQLELTYWEAAQKSLDALNDNDLHDVPVLHHMVAVTYLLEAVPADLRTSVRDQPPFEAKMFPLASTSAGIKTRRLAHRYFSDAVEVARQLDCPLAEKADEEYSLWLELTDPDPDKCGEGKIRLESKLRDLKTDLSLVRFGFQFEIDLDIKLVEQEIKRQIALNGKTTYDTAIARLALVSMQQTPEDAANYIARYHSELVGHIDKKAMLSLQIDLFSKSGQREKANECLDILLEEDLSKAEENQLRVRISGIGEVDSVENLKEQFKKTDLFSDSDLRNLVSELEVRNAWEDLCEYSEILFKRTRNLHDAERFALALHKTQSNERLVEFLESNQTIVTQSDELKMLYCWALYLKGKLLKARFELTKLNDNWDDENYRTLQVYLAISLGDWNSLSAFIANEYKEKEKRSAKELITASQLALHLDFIPHTKDLIFAAVEKGQDDANILGTAYFFATKAGWEDQEVSQWIHKAVELSGGDGPIWQMSLKEIWGQKQEWERRESEIWDKLNCGELPMFLAAHSLNRSLSDLMLFSALMNSMERDPRKRNNIPAYSGQRQPLHLDTGKQIGIDATALLTLSFLNLLDQALDAFDTVHISHSTLGWLFDEKLKVAFHQPSRIKEADQIRNLLVTGTLEKFSPSTGPDSELSEQVGEELALFIAEAEKGNREDNSRHIVVQPSPVHRIGSLMEKEADLTAHASVLSSCQSIVDKLFQKGRITESENRKARAYLQIQEKPWPKQPEIADRAILYLDEVAVKYFLHLGILEKLQSPDFKAIVAPRLVLETDQLISYERISDEAKDAIERIRSAVNSRIELGKIRVGRLTNADPSVDRSISEHPTATLFHLANYCDAIITDDRYLNRHDNLGDSDIAKPIFSTLDIIDVLAIDSETAADRLEYRTRLRRAGYIFVPVDKDELAHHIYAATVEGGKVVEKAGLRAIRENILCIRMSTWLQFPQETSWLNTLIQVFREVLKDLWKTTTDFVDTRARSNWIMDQINIMGWAHSFGKEDGYNIIKTGYGVYAQLVLTPPTDVPKQVENEYWGWLEERVLVPMKEQYPDLYFDLVEWYKKGIAKVADTGSAEAGQSDE